MSRSTPLRPKRWTFGRITRLLVLSAGAMIMLAPFIWGFSASLKPPAEIWSGSISLWPETFYGIENYTQALTRAPLWLFLINGVLVCIGILFFQVLFAVPCAYALSKTRFAGRTAIFAMVLIGLLIPIHVTAIPLYIAFANLGLLNTYTALIAPFAISVFGIFLFRQFFAAIPDELIAAARVDGFSEWTIVWRVVLPAAWPAVTAFAIFSVTSHWNDLFWPFIVIQSTELAPPPLGVLYFRRDESGVDFGPMMAATMIVTAPLVVAFLLAQRRFIDGITLSGLKG